MATIKIQLGSGRGNVGNNDSANQLDSSSNPALAKGQSPVTQSKSMAIAAGTSIITKTIDYTTSNIGKWTGNSQNQQKINNIKELFGVGVAFAVNPILGSVNLALNVGTKVIDEMWRLDQEQKSLAQARARNGYTDVKSITTSRRH